MLGRCWASSHCRPQADPGAMSGAGQGSGSAGVWAWGLSWGLAKSGTQNADRVSSLAFG